MGTYSSYENQHRAAYWYNEGNALIGAGDINGALDCYDKAIQVDPWFYLAWHNRGNAFSDMGNYEEGLKSIKRALSINPDFALAWCNKGIAQFHLNLVEEALESFDISLGIEPLGPDTWVAKGNCLNKLKRFQEAIECFDKALSIKPGFLALFNKGVSLHGLEFREEAIECYNKCLEEDSNHIDSYLNKGGILYELGRFEEAKQSFEKALKINPQDSKAWNNLGNVFMELGLSKEAGRCYKTAVEFDPGYAEPHFNLAMYYKGADLFEEAMKELREATINKPDYARAYWELGHIYMNQNKMDEAQAYYQLARRYDPERSNQDKIDVKEENAVEVAILSEYTNHGLKEFCENNYTKAAEYFKRALEDKPKWEELFYIYWFMGGSLRRIGKVEEAIKSLIDSLNCSQGKDRKEVAKVYNDLAIALEIKQLYDEAIKALEEAIKCRPDYIRAYIFLGKIYLHIEENNKAIESGKKVLELLADGKGIRDIIEPFRVSGDVVHTEALYISDAHTIIGIACGNKGKKDEARLHLQKAIDLNPNNSRAYKALNEPGQIEIPKEDKMERIQKHSIHPELHKNDGNIKLLWEKYEHLVTEAMAFKRQGMYEAAIRKLNQAKNELPMNGAELERGQCENIISLILMEQEKYEEALVLNEELIILFKKIGIKDSEAWVLTNRGLILNYYGKFSKAIEFINKALTVCKDILYTEGISSNLGNLGISFMELGDIERAIKYHLEALAIDVQYNFTENVAKDKGNLASCYFSLMLKAEDDREFDKLRDKTEKFQNDIVDYYKRICTDKFMILRAWLSLVSIEVEVGRRKKSREILNGCLYSLDEVTIFSNKINAKGSLFSIFRLKGVIYRYLFCIETDEAMRLGHISVSERLLHEANARIVVDPDLRCELAKTYKALSGVQENTYSLRLIQAHVCFEQAINEIERNRGEVVQHELKISLQGSQNKIFEDAVHLCIEMNNQCISIPQGDVLKKAFAYIESNKSRTLIELLGMTDIQPPGGLKREFSRLLEEEKKYISDIRVIRGRQGCTRSYVSYAAEDDEKLRDALNQLDGLYNNMESIFPETREYVFSRRGRPLGFDEIRKCLGEI